MMPRSSRRKMWMGPRGQERWVPAAKRGDFSPLGTRTKDDYINGGAGIRGSKDGHLEYNLSWDSVQPHEIRVIRDMALGLYDTGTGADLIYFIDPTKYEENVLAAMYAAPYKTGLDGVPLLTDSTGNYVYPSLVPTPRNTQDYPARTARYKVNSALVPTHVYVPIPDGKVLWVGVHGVDNGAAVAVFPVVGDALAPAVVPAMLGLDTNVRVDTPISSADGYTGVELALIARTAQPGSCDLTGIIVQILEPGQVPFTGGFISGQGNSGCEFDGIPTDSPYLNGRRTAMAARLVETGSWR